MAWNGAELHLLINHFPVILPLVGSAILGSGILFKSPDLRKAGLVLLIFSGAFAWASLLSGDPAEDVVKNYPGTDRLLIDEHQKAAKLSWAWALGVAALSGALLWTEAQKKSLPRFLSLALLALSLAGFAMMARTAHLGGMIRHEEVRGVAP